MPWQFCSFILKVICDTSKAVKSAESCPLAIYWPRGHRPLNSIRNLIEAILLLLSKDNSPQKENVALCNLFLGLILNVCNLLWSLAFCSRSFHWYNKLWLQQCTSPKDMRRSSSFLFIVPAQAHCAFKHSLVWSLVFCSYSLRRWCPVLSCPTLISKPGREIPANRPLLLTFLLNS